VGGRPIRSGIGGEFALFRGGSIRVGLDLDGIHVCRRDHGHRWAERKSSRIEVGAGSAGSPGGRAKFAPGTKKGWKKKARRDTLVRP